MVGNTVQHHVVSGWVTHNVFHSLQFGNVHARFHRHVEIHIACGKARALVAGNRFTDITFAPVVSCQGQVPIAKLFVQAL